MEEIKCPCCGATIEKPNSCIECRYCSINGEKKICERNSAELLELKPCGYFVKEGVY